MRTIAVAGKGGTGKTTVAALIVRCLSERGAKPILAVDADANVNLNDLLGVTLNETIGNIREEMKDRVSGLPGGMTKHQFLEYKIHASLVETARFDLVAMGRPEGPGCYCYANNLLRDILNTLSVNYTHVVIDNEAGLEHLSRRTTQRIDDLLVVADPSPRGIRAAAAISRLLKELDSRVDRKFLVLNRVRGPLPGPVGALIREAGLDLAASVPEDDHLLRMDQEGHSIWDVPTDSPVYRTVRRLLDDLTNDGKPREVSP
jgi:CO dehydrogenase maturation factor